MVRIVWWHLIGPIWRLKGQRQFHPISHDTNARARAAPPTRTAEGSWHLIHPTYLCLNVLLSSPVVWLWELRVRMCRAAGMGWIGWDCRWLVQWRWELRHARSQSLRLSAYIILYSTTFPWFSLSLFVCVCVRVCGGWVVSRPKWVRSWVLRQTPTHRPTYQQTTITTTSGTQRNAGERERE